MDVTLIDRRNFHLFQPLLYQVATGSLSPGEISAPLRGVLSKQKNATVLLGDVVEISPSTNSIQLADGATLKYDFLIVAVGAQSSYYGHDEWRTWAPSLKSIEEATEIRHKILYAFEVAERISDPAARASWLTFVIVGAGATGVELAGAIAEIARQTFKNDFRSIRPEEARIILMDGAPRVLMPFPEELSRKASKALERLGVLVRTGVTVKRIDREGVTISEGATEVRVDARTVGGRCCCSAAWKGPRQERWCRDGQERPDKSRIRPHAARISKCLRDRGSRPMPRSIGKTAARSRAVCDAGRSVRG
jgi:NADH dehydrogenase